MGWPGPLARLDPESRVLVVSLAISIAIHALAMSVHFKFPDGRRLPSTNSLDVVFVNSKTRSQPVKADVLAQANLDGGGNTDENRRAKTPLPRMDREQRGNDLTQATRRVEELEAVQKQLLSQVESKSAVSVEEAKPRSEQQPPQISGRDLAQSAIAIARLQAQISRNSDEYNKRPRKVFVGARASEYRYAQYVEDWRLKIERIGNLNYPDSARGRVYGSLRMAVSINSDGTLAAVELERSSGYKVLDAAAERIVQMAAPYARFPPEVRRDTDILVITRTWHFAPGDRLFSE